MARSFEPTSPRSEHYLPQAAALHARCLHITADRVDRSDRVQREFAAVQRSERASNSPGRLHRAEEHRICRPLIFS